MLVCRQSHIKTFQAASIGIHNHCGWNIVHSECLDSGWSLDRAVLHSKVLSKFHSIKFELQDYRVDLTRLFSQEQYWVYPRLLLLLFYLARTSLLYWRCRLQFFSLNAKEKALNLICFDKSIFILASHERWMKKFASKKMCIFRQFFSHSFAYGSAMCKDLKSDAGNFSALNEMHNGAFMPYPIFWPSPRANLLAS